MKKGAEYIHDILLIYIDIYDVDIYLLPGGIRKFLRVMITNIP